jgi:site-specific DNA-methyltransferase (adenine-specific)
VLKTMADNSVDSIVCDPPYELGFMGKRWDASGIAYDTTLWTECLRVLKPGGHLVAFGGTRTYHRMTVAIEDAGFEIRDSIIWMYGSGFPKSLDVSKAIDKQAGAEREVVGQSQWYGRQPNKRNNESSLYGSYNADNHSATSTTAPATPEAQQWHGYGTAIKPAHEPAVLARKPLTGTVADNVLTWGVGALNIDGCRVATDENLNGGTYSSNSDFIKNPNNIFGERKKVHNGFMQPSGRWPANVILDEHAAEALDEQSGLVGGHTPIYRSRKFIGWQKTGELEDCKPQGYSDSGGASRFFYIAKASRAEREAGLDAPAGERANIHPTLKPIALMRHLVRLVTPKGGTVLDPFMGSGSTGCAAMLEGMRFVGIDITAEYVDIAERRIQHWLNQNPMEL